MSEKSKKISESLKKFADDTSKANSQISSSTNPASSRSPDSESPDLDFNAERLHELPGEPNCPHCQGMGYLRQDLPLGHPDFGKVHVCNCRQGQINQQARQRLYELSHLDELSHLNFNNFEPRGRVGLWPAQADSLERSFNHAEQFSQSLQGWLLLQGDYGCGKTHLAAAIANFAVELGVPTLFITVPDLLDTLRFAYNDPSETFEERFNKIRTSKLLILDDFGTQNATEWAQEKLFQIINYRYINKLPLVVTTNLLLADIEGRIRSRLEDPDLVSSVRILAPDYRNPTGDIGHHKLSSLDLLHNRKFANFDLRQGEDLAAGELKSLEKAFNAAQDYAEKPIGWLVLMGSYGSGKTHLAAAIANFRADAQVPPLFVVIPDLMDHLRATFSPHSTISLDRRFEEVRTAPLLVLDDLGTQSSTQWVKEKLYQLFNYRYNAELPTVITTAASMDEMDPRIRSRMLDRRLCAIYGITTPTYTGVVKRSRGRRSRSR
ncbi:ATP-binding protein [Chloroflexota bacterium]